MSDKNKVDNLINDSYAAVILAAGYSSRMKAFKPLLPVGDMTAIDRSIAAAKGAGIFDIAVVTGHNREMLASSIKKAAVGSCGEQVKVFEAYNAAFADGMFSSIKAGISVVNQRKPHVKGIFLMPVDCPLISSAVLDELMVRTTDDDFCVPVFEGKKGHPLFIPKKYFGEICEYDGPGGLKGITDKYWDKMKRVPVAEEGCILDMDTPEGYEEIKGFLSAGCIRAPLHELAKGRKIFLIRHGQTKQHDEKMFIGRYDVPLEGGSEEKIAEMARRLEKEISYEDSYEQRIRIYTSPLQRAKQTAEIMKETLAERNVELCIEKDFQEISLGEWDGRPIREVKEMYPEEYDRRGRDMFTFKTGNKAENFYDVQYRVVKALRKILEKDMSKNIIIVSHSAVIRSLENNLNGLKVDDIWNPIGKGEYRTIEL